MKVIPALLFGNAETPGCTLAIYAEPDIKRNRLYPVEMTCDPDA